MRELGYVEGKNLVVDGRFGEGHIERLPSLTSELIALRPDVIVAIATPAIAALAAGWGGLTDRSTVLDASALTA